MDTKTFIEIGLASKLLGVGDQWLRRNWNTAGLTCMVLPTGHRRFVLEEVQQLQRAMMSAKHLKTNK